MSFANDYMGTFFSSFLLLI